MCNKSSIERVGNWRGMKEKREGKKSEERIEREWKRKDKKCHAA